MNNENDEILVYTVGPMYFGLNFQIQWWNYEILQCWMVYYDNQNTSIKSMSSFTHILEVEFVLQWINKLARHHGLQLSLRDFPLV
jgi:hypothetical protein